MSQSKENIHKNHRSRMRETIRKTGVDGISDVNLLEYLLFYSIPRKDTNEIAHRLLDAFGSLNGVFNATYDQLLDVEGMGENSALLISLVPGICRRYIDSGYGKKINLSEPEDLMEYIKTRYYGERKEVFCVVCLDALGNLINSFKLSEGSPETVSFDKRAILETTLRVKADTVVFVHNHPNGVAAPSRNDVDVTSEFLTVFRKVGIKFADHIIVAGEDTFSFATSYKYSKMFL